MSNPGRTLEIYQRLYVNGYDLSGDVRKFGEMGVVGDLADTTAPCVDTIKNSLVNRVEIPLGATNVLWNNAATGAHTIANGWQGFGRQVMIPIGQVAAPAQGDKVFAGAFILDDYKFSIEGGVAVATFKWGAWDEEQLINYINPFGALLHAKGAETAANTAVGFDDGAGAQTTFGGWLMYHLFSSDGTVTLKVQDAATNLDGSFADLSGATSGSINASVTPQSGIVALANTATIRQFLRWQIALGTAMTATFALSFHRARF